MTLAAVVLPDGSGYVVAAYLVFFAILVVYLAITAYRLVGLEQQLTAIQQQLDDAERVRGPEQDEVPS